VRLVVRDAGQDEIRLNPVRRLAAGRAERGQNIAERQALTHSWRRAME